jgi:hypothetical protein
MYERQGSCCTGTASGRDPESQDFELGRVHEHETCLRPLRHEAPRILYFIGLAPLAWGEKWIHCSFRVMRCAEDIECLVSTRGHVVLTLLLVPRADVFVACGLPELCVVLYPKDRSVQMHLKIITTNQLSMSRLSRQCGILNISQPCRPLRPVTEIALPFYFHFNYYVYRNA